MMTCDLPLAVLAWLAVFLVAAILAWLILAIITAIIDMRRGY